MSGGQSHFSGHLHGYCGEEDPDGHSRADSSGCPPEEQAGSAKREASEADRSGCLGQGRHPASRPALPGEDSDGVVQRGNSVRLVRYNGSNTLSMGMYRSITALSAAITT